MKQEIRKDIYRKRSQITVDALKTNGYEAYYVDNSKEALNKILSFIPKDATIGIGGSVTVREIGLVEALQKQGNIIFADWGESL
jgi:L-lactate utilization protein LutB